MKPKFRAWHKGAKCWVDIYALDYCCNDLESIYCGWEEVSQNRYWCGSEACHGSCCKFIKENKSEHLSLDDVELMQWTGLKDDKGVDIYEGDIISNDWGENYVYCTVEYNAEEGYWQVRHLGSGETDMLYEMNEKVIGNIYQNPELLEII